MCQRDFALRNKSIRGIVIEFSSGFLIAGLLTIFYTLKSNGPIVIFAQLLFIGVYLYFFRFVLDMLMNSFSFLLFFSISILLLSIVTYFVSVSNNTELTDLVALTGSLASLFTFMAFCRPKHVSRIGWEVSYE
ncbi:hypothetical protein C7Y69_21280 [Alteromonas sp. KS69]|jgi:hypothetical protein|nr:hypothetical protein C7Y69_21280 [Alteromonas sp. KS69]